jgi:hypothetical protein
MVNRYNISLNYKLESLQNDTWVQKKYDMKAINKDGLTLGFDLQKAVVIPYALINLVNK